MPQFELEREEGLIQVRGRSIEDALLRALQVAETASVVIDPTSDLHGWRRVSIDGEPAGRIRPFHRMRFRRD